MKRSRRIALSACGTVLLALLWAAGARSLGASIILPGPVETLVRFTQSLAHAQFYHHLLATLARSVTAFCTAYLIGIVWGLAAGLSPSANAVLRPALLVMRATPVIAVILLSLIWFSSSFAPLFVTVLMVLPLVVESVAAGVASSAPRLLEMATVFGVSRPRVIRQIVIPALRPSLIASSHAGLGMAFKVTVAAEVLVQPPWSLGGQMQEARFFLDTPRILALTVTVVLLSAASDVVLRLIGRVSVRLRERNEKRREQVNAGAGVPQRTEAPVERLGHPQSLVIEHLSVMRGDGEVIQDLSLAVAPGTVTVIFGPSGCGKSTLLHTISGLVLQSAGRIVPATTRSVSIAFQNPRLLPLGTARANVEFIHNEPFPSADELLALCGLNGWQNVDTRKFSGGMEQRVNLARAFSARREILLLDEPLQNLDLASSMGLAEEVRRRTVEEGRATVAVTHDVTEALLLADRVVLLSARPATVVMEQDVALAHSDRDPRTAAFQQISSKLYSALLRHSQA